MFKGFWVDYIRLMFLTVFFLLLHHRLSLSCLHPPLPPLRPPAGLLTDRRLLQEPLPGGTPAQGGQRGSAGVQGDSSDIHPRAEESDDKTYI